MRKPLSMVLCAIVSPAFTGLSVESARAQSKLVEKYSTHIATTERDECLAVDMHPNRLESFIAGRTQGVMFGSASGSGDAFVTLQRHDGATVWSDQFGSADIDEATGVVCDAAGGAIVSGNTLGEMAGPGSNNGNFDLFIRAYDSGGGVLWTKQFGSPGDDIALGSCRDGAGGCYITGYTTDALFGASNGSIDAFVIRIDGDGDVVFEHQIGTPEADFGVAVANDRGQGVFMIGETDGALIGPNAGFADIMVTRFEADGTQSWANQFGSPGWERGNAIISDGLGGAYLGGMTEGDMSGPNAGLGDAILITINDRGDELIRRQFGTPEDDEILGLAPDDSDGVHAFGNSRGNLFGTNQGERDIFHAAFTRGLQMVASGVTGTVEDDELRAVLAEWTEALYTLSIVGSTTGDLYAPNMGGSDGFFAVFEKEEQPCYADCDPSTGPGVLDVFDFLCFQNSFVGGEPYACECDTTTGPGVCDVFDFLCFQNAFVGGCP